MIDLFYWTRDKVDLYMRAAEYTRFNDAIARIVLDQVGPGRELWDLGCGVSYLALYLSPYMKKIDCVDQSQEALDGLKLSLEKKKLANIQLYKEDCQDFLRREGKGDCILLSHFLNIHDNLEELLARSKSLVIIRNSIVRREKGLFPGRKESIEDVENAILAYDENLKYRKFIYEGDFGQPLKSLEEAQDYYRSYSGKSLEQDDLVKVLEFREGQPYPYYFPKNKSIGIIFLDRS